MNAPETTKKHAPLVAGARPTGIVPTDIDQVWRLAQMIHKAGMAPKDFDSSEKISVALMHGLEIGLTPMMAMQRIAVINGRPALWGDGAIGLVRASGLCEYVDEEIIGDGDQMVAVCKTKRKGERKEVERTFSISDARKANLWDDAKIVRRRTKAGEWYEKENDSPWYRYPKRMLQMRARGLVLRDVYADVLGGLYLAEELESPGEHDERINRAKDVTPTQPVTPAETQEISAKAHHRELPPEIKGGPVIEHDADRDPLDIPPELDRRKKRTPPDASEWLRNLDGALSGCTTTDELASVQNEIQIPMKDVVSEDEYAEGQKLVMAAFARISEDV